VGNGREPAVLLFLRPLLLGVGRAPGTASWPVTSGILVGQPGRRTLEKPYRRPGGPSLVSRFHPFPRPPRRRGQLSGDQRQARLRQGRRLQGLPRHGAQHHQAMARGTGSSPRQGSGRTRQPRQDRIPRQHEPRVPYAAEFDHRIFGTHRHGHPRPPGQREIC